jgi:hypothetical protein
LGMAGPWQGEARRGKAGGGSTRQPAKKEPTLWRKLESRRQHHQDASSSNELEYIIISLSPASKSSCSVPLCSACVLCTKAQVQTRYAGV